MPRNIEIKARIESVESLLQRARALADGAAELIDQDDSFFSVAHGRLKLREFADGSADLIHHHRPDVPQATASDCVRVPVADTAALREALGRACGRAGRLRKCRWCRARPPAIALRPTRAQVADRCTPSCARRRASRSAARAARRASV